MGAVFTSVCNELGAFLEEFDGEEDHVHLLVGRLKGASSKILKDIFPDLWVSCKKGALLSPSYCAVSCGGASLDVVKKYIQNQCTPS